MKVRARSVIFGILGLLVLIVIGGLTAVGWQVVLGPDARPLTNRTFERTPERLARGQYIVQGPAHCFHCHSEHDLTRPDGPIKPTMMGAGWELPIPELGTIYAPNITPDPETGIGKWSDDAIVRAIQEGVDANGRALFPVMPYLDFRNLDNEDVASIVVYLRSIPPVKNAVPASKLVTPLNFIVNTIPKPLVSHTDPPARTTAVARGEYLVKTVAGCPGCHTPADTQGKPLPGLDLAGGQPFHDPFHTNAIVTSMNITQDASGIAHYDEALFIQTMRTGRMGGRQLTPVMPFEFFKNMTDDDLRDVFAFLKTVAPVKHRVDNTDPPEACPVCGYSHGLGSKNVKPVK
jgi:mono/diheme cytochrome c family protein